MSRTSVLPPLSGRIPSLDGLRAVAVLLVINGHLQGALDNPVWSAINRPIPTGDFGVLIFFVISGFLITTLLSRELDRDGRIHFGAFFKRRSLRIMPAFYVYIAVIVTVAWTTGIFEVTWSNALAAATYVLNYLPFNDSWQLGHAWSLSIEEQFYLLWPVTLALFGVKRAMWVALAGIVGIPLIRIALLLYAPEHPLAAVDRTHIRADALLIGCLLALLWHRSESFRRRAGRAVNSPLPLVALLWLPVSALARREWGQDWSFTVGYTVDTLAVALLLTWLVSHPQGRVGRAFNGRVLTRIGVMSYSLYLWQQPFLWDEITGVLANPAVRLACIFIAAELSLRFVERPFLRLKDRSAPSAPRADDDPVTASR